MLISNTGVSKLEYIVGRSKLLFGEEVRFTQYEHYVVAQEQHSDGERYMEITNRFLNAEDEQGLWALDIEDAVHMVSDYGDTRMYGDCVEYVTLGSTNDIFYYLNKLCNKYDTEEEYWDAYEANEY